MLIDNQSISTIPPSHKGDLKYHVKKKHPQMPDLASRISKSRSQVKDKPHCCTYPGCKSGYSRERDLKRHLKVKHGQNTVKKLFMTKQLPQFSPSVIDSYAQVSPHLLYLGTLGLGNLQWLLSHILYCSSSWPFIPPPYFFIFLFTIVVVLLNALLSSFKLPASEP